MQSFGVDDLIAAYRTGVFPMADDREDETLYLVDPPLRGIMPLDTVHIPSRLRRTLRSHNYDIRIDTAFSEMISLCAQSVDNRSTTWISKGIEALYVALFSRGMAHSVEVWDNETLIGGLYGVSIGGAFFGESMVSRARDVSKIAFVHLAARLIVGGYSLLDCQFRTEHLGQFGVYEIAREAYRERLHEALAIKGDFYSLPKGVDGQTIIDIADRFK
jgi:leucyl/phenylalanyl-tRNA--protein transferase